MQSRKFIGKFLSKIGLWPMIIFALFALLSLPFLMGQKSENPLIQKTESKTTHAAFQHQFENAF